MTSDKRYPDTRPRLVCSVVLTKEFEQMLLFVYSSQHVFDVSEPWGVRLTEDALLEEEPQNTSVSQEANGISKHELCPNSPPEKAKIRGVPEIAI